jgi:hypothetical protein
MLPIRPFRVNTSRFDAFELKFRELGIIYKLAEPTDQNTGQTAKLVLDDRVYTMGIHTIDREADIVEGGVWLLDDSTMNTNDTLAEKLQIILGEKPNAFSDGALKQLPFSGFIRFFGRVRIVVRISIWILAHVGAATILNRIIG